MKNLLFIVVVFKLISCSEPFAFEPRDEDSFLVVDGSITNEFKSHQVRLIIAESLDSSKVIPVTGATVFVEDQNGTQIPYLENEKGGTYVTAELAGVTGNSYKLIVTLEDNQRYESTVSTLLPELEIDSIYDSFEEIIDPNSEEFTSGIQFFINSTDQSHEGIHFRYQWEETYEILVPYPSSWNWDRETETPFARDTLIGICYGVENSSRILISKSESPGIVSEFPVRFVASGKQQLRTHYSINVKQMSIDQNTFEYFRRLKQNNEESGSLFDRQQGPITGNIQNVSNPDNNALGYFEVAGVSEKRAFFRANKLDPPFKTPTFLYDCLESEIIASSVDSIGYYMRFFNYDLNIYFIQVNAFLPPVAFLVNKECSECIEYASTQKPDFWID